jgi:hypothetical protein
MRQFMGAIAEWEKSITVRKLRAARTRIRAKEGRCEGRKPYGYFDGETRIIERMKALRSAGMGYDRVAQHLNAEGVKPRAGKRWHGVVVIISLARSVDCTVCSLNGSIQRWERAVTHSRVIKLSNTGWWTSVQAR